MKRLFLTLSLLTSISIQFSSPISYETTLIALNGAPAQDTQLLLNLVYWSYMRSETTRAVQEPLLEHLHQGWKMWANCSATRRNPRTTLPYKEDIVVDATMANLALQAQQAVNQAYISVLEHAVEKGNNIASAAIKEYITQLREQARAEIGRTIINSFVNIEQALSLLQTKSETPHSRKFIHDMNIFAQELERNTNKNIFNDGIDYLMNGLALQSFGQFDKKYVTASDEFFKVLLESQTIYAQLWQQLETARAQYYKNAYKTIYSCLIELKFPSSCFLNMFDEQGIIVPEEQMPLPALIL